MYMPILRGKRFELLALRDMASDCAAGSSIVPIVEPVKVGTVSTELRRAIDGWIGANGSLGLVVNPTVGELKDRLPAQVVLDELAAIYEAVSEEDSRAFEPIQDRLFPILVVSTDGEEFRQGLDALRAALGEDGEVALWLRDNVPTEMVALAARAAGVKVNYVLASEARLGKRVARELGANPGLEPDVVVFADQFPGRSTNAEYPDQREQVFTEEHMYFRDDGLAGFSDFGTIGDDYRDGGGAPKYVVIHWTYQHAKDSPQTSPVYLQHFCSEDESVVAPVQTKYADAANKLITYAQTASLAETSGLTLLREYHREGRFPGLGMLKKISIMNHLAVMRRALRRAGV